MFYCLITIDDSLNSMLFQRKSGGVKGLSNDLMQLRKICQHPFLFESVEDEISLGGYVDDKLIRTSEKLNYCIVSCLNFLLQITE
jgi:SNF2 family DNA or RNA helicase